MADRKASDARAAAIAEQMAGLAKAAPAPEPAKARTTTRERKRPARGRPAAAPMPAEAPRPARYDKRVPLMTTQEQHRALVLARAEDGIEATARLRALIQLWMEDDRLRARADKLARTLR